MARKSKKKRQNYTPAPLPDLPQGLNISTSHDELIIHRRWLRREAIGLAIFGLIWNGFLIYYALDEGIWIYFVLPHGWIGLAVAYYTLLHLFNTTTITITPSHLSIRHHPIPYLGNKQLEANQINQLYTKIKQRKQPTYEVRVITDTGRDTTLVTELKSADQAAYVAYQIEHYLGIDDKPVSGESSKLTPYYHPFKQNSWQRFAAKNKFHFREYGIIGTHQGYDFCLLPQHSNSAADIETYMRLTVSLENQAAANNTAEFAKPFDKKDVTNLIISASDNFSLNGKVFSHNQGREISYIQLGLEDSDKYLQAILDFLTILAQIYPRVVALGGEVGPILQPITLGKEYVLQPLPQLPQDKDHPLRAVAIELLRDIGRQTAHLSRQLDQLVCQYCLLRFTRHTVDIPEWDKITYYGCRGCHQSREFYLTNQVAAVLDAPMTAKFDDQNQTLRVNWLTRRIAFDFDSVEIIDATDEDIERLVVQIGNDTDSIRQPRYKDMPCVVSSQCQLSPNSLRVLQRTFGHVDVISLTS